MDTQNSARPPVERTLLFIGPSVGLQFFLGEGVVQGVEVVE